MGTTPNYAWRYPELTDPPDGATQIKNLALDADASLKVLDTAQNTPALCVVESGTAQSIPNTAWTPIDFDTDIVDTKDMHSTTTNKMRLTCKLAGWYQLSGVVTFATSPTGRRYAGWYLNGVAISTGYVMLGAASAGGLHLPAPTSFVRLALNDYVDLRVYQDSGAALLTLAPSSLRSFASALFICP